jgi:hypothetical protein
VSTAREIEAAMRMLSPVEREKLIKNLPVLLPELDGDMAWNRIMGDTRTRPGLPALLDQVEADYKKNPAAFPEVNDKMISVRRVNPWFGFCWKTPSCQKGANSGATKSTRPRQRTGP